MISIDSLNTLSNLSHTTHHQQLLRVYPTFSHPTFSRGNGFFPCISSSIYDTSRKWIQILVIRGRKRVGFEVRCRREKLKTKGKENVWSIDNEMPNVEKVKQRMSSKKNKGKRVKNVKMKGDKVMVSDSMLMEVETVLQPQEPVILPAWNTFVSSVSGIWKGVGAVFSPITAKMEPIDIGSRNENLFDCYILSRIEAVPSTPRILTSQVKRTINWVTLNTFGEVQNNENFTEKKDQDLKVGNWNHQNLPKFESFDFGRSDVMEEDIMGMEPGLVFFQDGSYSRGPVDIPVAGFDESKYYLSPTFKFEQCLVKGGHKRLRIVHTIEFGNMGSHIQIMRVAVYEEEWFSPVNISFASESELAMKPFSQRTRIQPSELTGSWKVFEISATPIHGEETIIEETNSVPFAYFCAENLITRSSPENLVYFGEEEMVDMQDVSILWLPGGVTAYVDINKEGILCIGVCWYSDEGINLVIERAYGLDGRLKECVWKSEMKRRWTNPPSM